MIGFCMYCGKRPRGKMAVANFERYWPFCTYDHQQRYNLADACEYLAELEALVAGEKERMPS